MTKEKMTPLPVRFTAKEHEELAALANQANTTKAEVMRRLLAGESQNTTLVERNQEFEDLLDAIKELRACRADLARIGNLLKLALDDDHWADDFRQPKRVWECFEELQDIKNGMEPILQKFRDLANANRGRAAA